MLPVNVASQANGGTATASTQFSGSYPATAANDGTRNCATPNAYGAGSTWASSSGAVPQWLEIDFNASYVIVEIDVITLRDDFSNTALPTLSDTFSSYGLQDFDVQYWNGSSWTTIQSVTGNNKVWRQFTFGAITTSKIRIYVNTGGPDGFSRLVELEAWTSAGGIPLYIQPGLLNSGMQALNGGFQ